jgi:type I restriction enzyme S subunit
MTKEWTRRKLGDVLSIQNGYAFDSKGFNAKSGMPLIRIRSLKKGVETETRFSGEYDKRYVVNAGDLLIGMDGEFGCYEWKGEPALLNQRVCRLEEFSEALSPRFLLYGVNSYLKAIEEITGFTTVKHLSSKQILAIQFPVPPWSEQQRIVAILDEAFVGIATAKANAEKNLQNARAIFEGQRQRIFSQRGQGWVQTALGKFCEFVRGPFGGSLKKAIFVADGYAVYEQQHAIYDQFDDVRYYINEDKFSEMKRFELRPGDLIMSCSGTMGRVAIAPMSIRRGIINQALLKLTPGPRVLGQFLKYWMTSEAFRDALMEYSGGAAIQNVASVSTLKEIKVPLPSIVDQHRVIEELNALSDQTQRLAAIYERKLAALEALKKSLLHNAFAGELAASKTA